jgi:5-(carboxyamino)imidazole ribonucleotide mutase
MRKVLILLSDQSDLILTERGQEILKDFKMPYELRIASAHRSPAFVEELVKNFESRGGLAIICVASTSTHLAGLVASLSILPVLAVPVATVSFAGFDASLNMNQMPADIPIATMTVGEAGFINAAIFVLQLIATQDKTMSNDLKRYRAQQTSSILESDFQNRVIYDL